MRALRAEPEDGGGAGRARTRDGEAHPVAHGRVLGLAHAPHVACLDAVLEEGVASAVTDPDDASRGRLEGLVVRPVLLGGLEGAALTIVSHACLLPSHHRRALACAMSPTLAVEPILDTENWPCFLQSAMTDA